MERQLPPGTQTYVARQLNGDTCLDLHVFPTGGLERLQGKPVLEHETPSSETGPSQTHSHNVPVRSSHGSNSPRVSRSTTSGFCSAMFSN